MRARVRASSLAVVLVPLSTGSRLEEAPLSTGDRPTPHEGDQRGTTENDPRT